MPLPSLPAPVSYTHLDVYKRQALTIIDNAGQARIKGLETDLEFAATEGLTLSGGFSLIDSKLTQEFCKGCLLYTSRCV